MMNYRKVDLEKTFAKKLGMRSTAKRLFDDLNKESSDVTLNFENIRFISRSFAQEYVCQKRMSKLNINEENMSEFVKNILTVAEEEYLEK